MSYDYAFSALSDWGNRLYALNNPSAEKLARFYDYPEKDQLTGMKKLSSETFVLACYGLAYAESFGRRLGLTGNDGAKKSMVGHAFDAWRRNTHKNSRQGFYTAFEACLAETIEKYGAQAALKAFPTEFQTDPQIVLEALERLNFDHVHLGKDTVKRLLKQLSPAPAAPAPTVNSL